LKGEGKLKKYKGMYKELFKKVYSINDKLEECNSLSEAKDLLNVTKTGSGAFMFEEEVNDGAVKICGEVKEDEGKIQLENNFELYYPDMVNSLLISDEELYQLSKSNVLIAFDTIVKEELFSIEIYESVLEAIEQKWESLYFSKNEELFATICRGKNKLNLTTAGEVRLVNDDKDITLYNDYQDEIRELLKNGDVEEQGYMIGNSNWFSISFNEYYDDNWFLVDDIPFEDCPKNLEGIEVALKEFIEYFIDLRRNQLLEKLEREYNDYFEKLSHYTAEQLKDEAYQIGITEELFRFANKWLDNRVDEQDNMNELIDAMLICENSLEHLFQMWIPVQGLDSDLYGLFTNLEPENFKESKESLVKELVI
jgi:hypothetical protein